MEVYKLREIIWSAQGIFLEILSLQTRWSATRTSGQHMNAVNSELLIQQIIPSPECFEIAKKASFFVSRVFVSQSSLLQVHNCDV